MRLAIVSGAGVAVRALAELVTCRPENEVIWTANDEMEAAVRCRRHKPELVLLDMSTPGFDAVAAVRRIMAETPCRVLLLTTTGRGNVSDVFRAMSHGALDAVTLPVLEGGADESGAAELLEKIQRVAKLGAGKPGSERRARSSTPMVIVGASSGGPSALATVLAQLPRDLGSPVVVIQHVDEGFADGLAEWLGESSSLPVTIIRSGDRPIAGHVSLASTNDHLVLAPMGHFEYVREPAELAYRPSIDVFCASVAARSEPPGVAVIMTGIGRDGGAGLLKLRQLGWHTIAQDKATSVVYGMPRVAAELGAAIEILALDEIAKSICAHLSATRTSAR